MTKQDLYLIGVGAAIEFLQFNKLPLPVFMTYEEALNGKRVSHAIELLHRVHNGPIQGTRTGLYSKGYVFVNVPVTAAPVQNPSMRNWSWPGWKIDRTAVGVVAHEVGHHVGELLADKLTTLELCKSRTEWLQCIKGKKVSGYEPVPEEAAAESMRLFILNPDLLRKAIPRRYYFLCELGLKPLPRLLKKGYAKVLNNAAYLPAAERFVS
jgi:hypothetical protein